VKLCESGGEIRSSCKRGSESSWSEWFDINLVGWGGQVPLALEFLERSDGYCNVHGDKVVNGGFAPMGPSKSTP